MRNNDPLFFPNADLQTSIRQQMERNYSDCINILQTQWYQADLDERFYMGDQELWGLIFPGVATYRKKSWFFNLINSHVQMASGFQRRNRKSTICIPTLPTMQKTADQLTKCLYAVHGNGGYQVYSDMFEKMLVQGIGLMGIHKDTTNDPVSGDIKLRVVDFRSILIDPFFRKHDLSDCRFIWTRQFFDRLEAATLYPQFADEIMSLAKGTYRDDKFYYMPEVYQIQFPNLIAFDEYWYLTSRNARYLVDIETNETNEFVGDEEDLRVIMYHFKDRLRIIDQPKPTVRRSIILNDKVMLDEANPYGIDRYPYVCCLGYFSPDSPYYAYKFRGMVRDLRDCQYLFTRRKVSDLDILEAQQQGLKIREGSLVTPDDALNQGNGRALFYKKTGSPDDIQPMPIVPPAPTMIQMEEMLKELMSNISGVNETLLGTDINDKAGIISMMRNSAGITTLTKLFDQFDEAQRQAGEIIVEMIQKNWTYGKVKSIIGEEPSAEFENKAFFKYGCKVIQGALTESQQQLQLAQLLYFRETTGIDIPSSEIIKNSTLQGKDELVKAIEEREQAAAEQQQMMQALEMEQLRINNDAILAESESKRGLAHEREAKIGLDRALNAERIQRAKEDKSAAILNLVKAAKELRGMDLEHRGQDLAHLEQAVNILQTLNSDGEDEESGGTKEKSKLTSKKEVTHG